MGETLSKVGKSIIDAVVDISMKIIIFFNPIIIKRKKGSKQNEEDKDRNKFQRAHRLEREIMNNYQRRNWNQQYNKMYDPRLKDYRGYDDDVDFDYY